MTRAESVEESSIPEEAKPTCFVISPIGQDGSPERRHADSIIRHVIGPAAIQAGFQAPLRADMMATPGMITEQIVERLLNADVVVADLTGHNPNVFYELAMRHAFKKPAVLLYHPNEQIPFDVHDLRAIPVTTHIDDAVPARETLTQALRLILEHPDEVAASPFARGLDYAAALNDARQSAGSTESQMLALAGRRATSAELADRPSGDSPLGDGADASSHAG